MKIIPLTAAFALSFSLATPAVSVAEETPDASTADAGAVAIPLTTSNGELTDVAQQGFDVEATSETPAELTRILLAPVARTTPQLASNIRMNVDEISDTISENYELFSAPIAIDDPFAVAGMTWESDTPFPSDATIEMRTLDAGQWSEWYSIDVEDNCPAEAARCGSEYMISGASEGIQARISRTASALPSDLRIDISYSPSGEEDIIDDPDLTDVLPPVASLTKTYSENNIMLASYTSADTTLQRVDAGAQAVQANVQLQTAPVITAQLPLVTNKANIKTRAQWGNTNPSYGWTPEYVKFEGVIIHHTAGSNVYTQAQVPSVLQGIYRYHAITLDWGDIGYNVLIDKYGGRWEGRLGTLSSAKTQMVIGGHAIPRNERTMGVSVLGDYTQVQPTAAVITALSEVSAWKFIEAGIDPASTSPLTIPSTTGTMKNQIGKPLNRIVGHKDVGATACPGSIYNSLNQIRTNVRTLFQQSSVPNQVAQAQKKLSANETATFRLFNTVTGEHLFTTDTHEVITITNGVWRYEGVAWVTPKRSSSAVYRLFSPKSNIHLYTSDKNEVRVLTTKAGWRDEGVAWYSAAKKGGVSVYRQFNPVSGAHLFTTDTNEYNVNNSRGWSGEGVAWYVSKKGW